MRRDVLHARHVYATACPCDEDAGFVRRSVWPNTIRWKHLTFHSDGGCSARYEDGVASSA